jgi:dolichol-phosphate mannosyltransferase
MLVTKIGYKILGYFSVVKQVSNSGDFKLLSRRVINEVTKLDEMEPFLRGLISWVGFNQVPLYYVREGRFAGTTHFIFYRSKVLKNFLSGITSFSDAPLYLTFTLGVGVSMLSFLYLAGVILMKIFGMNLPGWSAIMATILFLGGIQIMTIGILGLYIAKIHIEVKNRPNVIIDKKLNF